MFCREPVLFLPAFKTEITKYVSVDVRFTRTTESMTNPAEILHSVLLLCVLRVFVNFNTLLVFMF